ncbi:organic hydroperoxide resistance protein [Barrientosiimonas marina]|uniref:Organic hydroperoxide resistance protein n=1 Tax=Lentibacillus kimchii TaxID=1542911 RepID=A0ABW2UTM8_9BACI
MSEVIFTSSATAQNGRDGHVKSSDGLIDLDLVNPATNKEDKGSNPEQLFAAAYSACFDGALNLVASQQKKKIESETTADVSFCKDPSDDGFKIAATIHVKMKGADSEEEAQQLVKDAHQACPYSKATRGNIDVTLETEKVD